MQTSVSQVRVNGKGISTYPNQASRKSRFIKAHFKGYFKILLEVTRCSVKKVC